MASEPARTYPSELPVLALRQTVVFPLTVQPLAVNRPMSVEAVNRALAGDRLLFLTLQNGDSDEPGAGGPPADRHDRRHPADGQGPHRRHPHHRRRADAGARRPDHAERARRSRATVRPAPEQTERTLEVDAYVRRLQELVDRALSVTSGLSQELRGLVMGIDDPLRLAYVLASLLDIKADEKQHILEADDLTTKLKAVADALDARDLAPRAQGQDRVGGAAGDDRRAAAVLPAPAAEGDSGRARRGRKARGAGDPEADRRREAARRGGRGRQPRSRPARAHDAGVARVPDDPHLHRLGARRAVVGHDRRPARPGRGAPRPRRGSLRSRQGQGADRRVPRGPEAEARIGRGRFSASSARPASARRRSASRSRAR